MENRKKLKNILNILLLITFTIIVLYFSLKDNFKEIIHELLTINPFWLVLACFLFFSSLFVRSMGFNALTKQFSKNFSIKKSLSLVLKTQFFNAVTPFATGGQPFQIYMLKKDGIRISDGTNIVIQNFIVYQIALVILGIIAVGSNFIFHIFKDNQLLQYLTTLGFFMNIIVVIILFAIILAKRTNKKIIRKILNLLEKVHIISVEKKNQIYKKASASIKEFHDGGMILFKNKKLLFKTIFCNLSGLFLLYLVPLAIIFGLGIYDKLNIFTALVSSAYVMLIGAFVPIPGGTGGLEYSYCQFYGNFISGSKLHASMLIWRSITYYLGMLLGAIVLNLKERRK